MADTRTLKLSILADVDNFRKSLKKAESELKGFGDFTASIGNKISMAFKLAAAAATAYATKIAVDGVRAAIEDEAAQIRLANALRESTEATKRQIGEIESYITKAALATGVSDDQLRPAFQDLAAVTNDLTEAQSLLNLALEIQSATGLPLESIIKALSNAYEGNYKSLDKLLPQISAADLKGKSAAQVFQLLTDIFAGSIQANSDSLAARQARLAVAFAEVKEELGYALLPVFERLSEWLLESGLPALKAFIAGLTGDKSLSNSFSSSEKIAESWGQKVRGFLEFVIAYRKPLLELGAILVGIWAVAKISAAITTTIALVRGLIATYNALKASALLAGIAAYFALNPLAGIAAAAIAGAIMAKGAEILGNAFTPDFDVSTNLGSRPLGGVIPEGTTSFVPSVGAVTGGATGGGKIPEVPGLFENGPSPADFRKAEEGSMTNYINIYGPIDSESTAQAIVETLNKSTLRGGYGRQLIL